MACAAVMFLIELVLPWLIWLPGRWRRVPLVAFVAFQILIAVTGNYAFFNLLTIALCVFLADPGLLPRRWRPAAPAAEAAATLFGAWPRALLAPFVAVVVLVSAVHFSEATLRVGAPWPSPVFWLARAVSPLRSVNSYGLFAVMTTTRPEIVVEGSDDGETWRAYEFRYKPGDLHRRPGFVAPAPAPARLADVVRRPGGPATRAPGSRGSSSGFGRARRPSWAFSEATRSRTGRPATCGPFSTTTASRTSPPIGGRGSGGSAAWKPSSAVHDQAGERPNRRRAPSV